MIMMVVMTVEKVIMIMVKMMICYSDGGDGHDNAFLL